MAKGGEGSRGGTVIGHTKSGRPIYKDGKHHGHTGFSERDHKDAADLHHRITEMASKRLEEKRTTDNDFTPKDAKGVQEFLNHHYKTMTHHQLKANAKLNEREDREGKTRSRRKGKAGGAGVAEEGKALTPNKGDSKKDQILKELYKEVLRREKEGKKKINKSDELDKGGKGSGRKGHQTEGLSESQLHDRRTKFAHPQYAKFRHHSGDGLNDADRFKHGMVQDAVNSGYIKKSGYEGYNPGDNFHRKKNNIETGQSTGGAVGRRTKAYGGSGANAAGREAAEMRRRSKKNPVKVYTKEEIAALNKGKTAKYTKRTGSPGNYKYEYSESKKVDSSREEIIKEAFGKYITFSGPGAKEYSAHVYSEPEDGKVILKFDGHGFRRVEIASINNPHIQQPGKTVEAKGITKYGSEGWPPSGFVEPKKTGNKTTEKDWYKEGDPEKDGRPSTQGKKSKYVYMSPKGSTCNLVGNVAFGKASDKAQRQLNQKLQMTEVLLSDMGLKMKTPMDFICQDMDDGQRGVMAQFLPMNGHRNDRINLAKNLKTVNKSLLHEIGHGIDYAMEQKGIAGSYFRGNPTELKEEIEKLTDILRNSKFYEATGAKDAPGNIDDDFLEPDDRYANYLKDQSEVFARAFEVYTLDHALEMVSEGKLPQEYVDNFVPDYLKAGFTQKTIDPDAFDATMDGVRVIMDKIFRNRAIQKAMKEIDLLGYLKKSLEMDLSKFTTKELFIQGFDAKKLAKNRKAAGDKEGYDYWIKRLRRIAEYIRGNSFKKSAKAKIGELRTHRDGTTWKKEGVGKWTLQKESLTEDQKIEEAKREAIKAVGLKDPEVQLALRSKELELSIDTAVNKKFSGVNARRGARETLETSIKNIVRKGADPVEVIGLVHMMADGEKIFDFDEFEKASRDNNDLVSLTDFLPPGNKAAEDLLVDLADKIPAVSSRNVGKGEIMLAFMTSEAGKGTKGDLVINKPGEEEKPYELKTSSGVVTPKSVKSKKTYKEANKDLIDKMRAKGIADSDLPQRLEGKKKVHYDFSPERLSDLKSFRNAVEAGKMTEDEAKEMITDFFADIRDVPRSKIEENMKRIDVMNMDAHDLGKVLVDLDLDDYIAETGKLLVVDLNNPSKPKAAIITSAKDMLDMDAKGNVRIHAFASGYGQGEKNTNTHGAGISVHVTTPKVRDKSDRSRSSSETTTKIPKGTKEWYDDKVGKTVGMAGQSYDNFMGKLESVRKEGDILIAKVKMDNGEVQDVLASTLKMKQEPKIKKSIEELTKSNTNELFEILRKNVVSTDDQGSATETGMYSNDLYSNATNPLMDVIKEALEGSEFNGDPKRIMIAPGTILTCTKDTDGVYSGFVNRDNENILKIEKQTLPTLLQMLKIKEITPAVVDEPEKESSDYKMKVLDLLGKLL